MPTYYLNALNIDSIALAIPSITVPMAVTIPSTSACKTSDITAPTMMLTNANITPANMVAFPESIPAQYEINIPQIDITSSIPISANALSITPSISSNILIFSLHDFCVVLSGKRKRERWGEAPLEM